jgi:hypothetical protein
MNFADYTRRACRLLGAICQPLCLVPDPSIVNFQIWPPRKWFFSGSLYQRYTRKSVPVRFDFELQFEVFRAAIRVVEDTLYSVDEEKRVR